jgi:hypothetical protein
VKPVPSRLSKSRYTRGLQCLKSLWLYTYRPELRDAPDASVQKRFMVGHEVGELAWELFPGGTLIPFENVSFAEQIRLTREAMKKDKVIYEAAFRHKGVFIKADILRNGRHGWELYEVKSSNGTKDVYQNDIDVQYFVLEGAGITVGKSCIVHLNREYVRDGAIDVKALFSIKDVTAETRARQPKVKKEVARMQRILKGEEPEIDIGPHCDDPYPCDFEGHCWELIKGDTVFDLAGGGVDKFELYRQGMVNFEDIPLEFLKGKQRQQVEATLNKKVIINKKKLRNFLEQLWYPLCFLDFETFNFAVPPYNGLRPYQRAPFQYSLHYQKKAGGRLCHREYLAEPGMDPRKELLNRLLSDIPTDACILVYNKSFEIARLKELAEYFPRKKKKIQVVIDSVVDLIEPFRQRSIYSWKQRGAYGIKAVLPAFVPGMTYEGMEIGNGEQAMEAYHEMCGLVDRPRELARMRKALREYCRQDTLAMVKLVEVLEVAAT